MEESPPSLYDRPGARKAELRELRHSHTAVCRPSSTKPLRPSTVLQELQEPRRRTTGETEGIFHLSRVKTQQFACGSRRRKASARRGGMEASIIVRHRLSLRRNSEPDCNVVSSDNGRQE